MHKAQCVSLFTGKAMEGTGELGLPIRGHVIIMDGIISCTVIPLPGSWDLQWKSLFTIKNGSKIQYKTKQDSGNT